MGKAKKIIAGVLVVAVAGTGIGAGLMQLRNGVFQRHSDSDRG